MLQKTKSAPWDDPDRSIFPQVPVTQSRAPIILFSIALALFAIFLFTALENVRSAKDEPAVAVQSQAVPPSSAAELYIPPDTGPPPLTQDGPQPLRAYYPGVQNRPVRAVRPRATAVSGQPVQPYVSPAPSHAVESPPYVPPPLPQNYPVPPTRFPTADQANPLQAKPDADRIVAGRISSPSLTVVQGTLIGAVLETALDSTRPGAARALVTRDVKGFDGTRTLIPRGSRLYGEYQSDLAAGQNRALIRWTRLVRPDGVTVAINSPSADPLGRAGVRGSVNIHLLDRIAATVLQAGSSFGQAIVGRQAPQPVIVAVPGATQTVSTAIVDPQQIRPTLTVKPGTRVTVFVARDVDFSTVDTL